MKRILFAVTVFILLFSAQTMAASKKAHAKLDVRPLYCESPCEVTLSAKRSTSSRGAKIEKYIFDLGNGEVVESSNPVIKYTYKVLESDLETPTLKKGFRNFLKWLVNRIRNKHSIKVFDTSVSVIDSKNKKAKSPKKHIRIKAQEGQVEENISPVASFSFSTESNIAPATFKFDGSNSKDDDGEIKTYLYNFGDGSTSSEVSPTHLYQAAGSYNVSLVVTDDRGATNKIEQTIIVKENSAPTASFTLSTTSGKAPLKVSFDGSASSDSDGSIISYNWSIGSDFNSTGKLGEYTFTKAGSYSVELVVKDDRGATSTQVQNVIVTAANLSPNAIFTVSEGPYIAPQTISFKGDGSTDLDGTISAYHYDFGDGKTSDQANVDHAFNTAGTYNVVLTVTDNEGATSVFNKEIVIASNKAPVANFSLSNVDSIAPATYTFDGSSSTDADGSIKSYLFDFGDGQTSNTVTSNHIYQNAGTYTVSLTVTDNLGAINKSEKVIVIGANALPTPVFSYNPETGRAPLIVNFDSAGTSDSDGTIEEYTWKIGDTFTATGKTLEYTFDQAGSYVVVLTVKDNKGGTASKSSTITVLPPNVIPVAKFTISDGPYVAPQTVTFNGNESVDSDGSIVSYSFDFGDGTISDKAVSEHTYSQAGTYTVTLTVSDNSGATSKIEKSITVLENALPQALFTYTPDTGRLPLAVTFDASTSIDSDGSISEYSWKIGDYVATGKTLEYTFSEAGDFEVTLTINDDKGGLASKAATVKVLPANVAPTASFTLSEGPYVAPQVVSLNAEGSIDSDGTIASYSFDFGDGVTSDQAVTEHTYSQPGTYQISLTVTDGEGATATTTKSISVVENMVPIANISIEGDGALVPATITFNGAGSTDSDGTIVSWKWELEDGTTYDGKTVNHTFNSAGNYSVKLTVTDDRGATSFAQKNFSLIDDGNQKPVIAEVYHGRMQAGPPVKMFFGIDEASDADGEIVSYIWNFGDGQELEVPVSRDEEGFATHEYVREGTYQVKVTAVDDKGGRSEKIETVVVQNSKMPVARFTPSAFSGDAPLTVTFDASNSTDPDGTIGWYEWTVTENGNDTDYEGETQKVITHTFNEPGIHRVLLEAYDNTGGGDATMMYVYVGTPAPENGLAPKAMFSTSTRRGSEGTTISVDAGLSYDFDGEITSYKWNFSGYGMEGSITEGKTASFTYTRPGTYMISLTVTDNMGNSSSTYSSVYITNSVDIPANPEFFVFHDDGLAFELSSEFNFYGHSYNPDILYWDLGDGQRSEGFDVWHQYAQAGDYTIGLVMNEIDKGVFNVTKTLALSEDVIAPSITTQEQVKVASGVEYEFNACDSSSNDGSELKFRWYFGDGTEVNGTGTDFCKVKHTYQTNGFHDAYIVVTNGQEISESEWISVNVTGGEVPMATIVADSYQGMAPFTVTFDASGSVDPDGEIVSYQWSFDEAEGYSHPYGVGQSLTHTFEKPGRYEVQLTVVDNEGNASFADVEIEVTAPNSMPVAQFTCNTDIPGMLECHSTSYDPDGYLMNQSWFVNGQNVGSGDYLSYQLPSTGLFMVQLSVDDNEWNSAYAMQEITVQDEYSDLYASIEYFDTGAGSFQFNGSATNTSGQPILSYEWLIDGVISKSGQSISHTFSGGTHYIQLTVIDDKGNSAYANETISIAAPPVANLNCSIDNRIVNCDASGSTDDSMIISYNFDFGDGQSSQGNSVVSHTYSSPGEYEIILSVVDNDGLESQAVFVVNITNSAPVAKFECSSYGIQLNCDASSSFDPEGDFLSYKWFIGDVQLSETSTSLNEYLDRVGSKTVHLEVSDSYGMTSTVSKIVDITPVLYPDVSIVSDTLFGRPPFTFEGSADVKTMPNGDIVKYTWIVDDQEIDGSTLSYEFVDSGTYLVVLSVEDSIGVVTNTQVQVNVNTPPIANGQIEVTQVENGFMLYGEALDSYDPDGDLIKLSWELPSREIVFGRQFQKLIPFSGYFPIRLNVIDSSGVKITKILTVNTPELDLSVSNFALRDAIVGREYQYIPVIKFNEEVVTSKTNIQLVSSSEDAAVNDNVFKWIPESSGCKTFTLSIAYSSFNRNLNFEVCALDRKFSQSFESIMVGDSSSIIAPGTIFDGASLVKVNGDSVSGAKVYVSSDGNELFVDKVNEADEFDVYVVTPPGLGEVGDAAVSKSLNVTDFFSNDIGLPVGDGGIIEKFSLRKLIPCGESSSHACARFSSDELIKGIQYSPNMINSLNDASIGYVYFIGYSPSRSDLSRIESILNSASIAGDVAISFEPIPDTFDSNGTPKRTYGKYRSAGAGRILINSSEIWYSDIDMVLVHEYDHFSRDQRCHFKKGSHPVLWMIESLAEQSRYHFDSSRFFKSFESINGKSQHMGQYVTEQSLNIYSGDDSPLNRRYLGLFYPDIGVMFERWCIMDDNERRAFLDRSIKNKVNTSMIELSGYLNQFEAFAKHFLNYVTDLSIGRGVLGEAFPPVENLNVINRIGEYQFDMEPFSGKTIAISKALLSRGVIIRIENIEEGIVYNISGCRTFGSLASDCNAYVYGSETSKYSFEKLDSRVRWIFEKSEEGSDDGDLYIHFAYLWDHSKSNTVPSTSKTVRLNVLTVPSPVFNNPMAFPGAEGGTSLVKAGFTVYHELGGSLRFYALCPPPGYTHLFDLSAQVEISNVPVEDAVYIGSYVSSNDENMKVCNIVRDCISIPTSQAKNNASLFLQSCL